MASRQQIAATTGMDTGLAVLLGPISAIDTVGGYTVYKCFVFLTTIGAIWGVLTSTRLLRGEEDAGRWQLVLAGGTSATRATVATLAGIGAGVAIVFAGTTALVALAGRNPDVGFGLGESALYGLSIAVAPAVFAAVGAVTSQLGRTRRPASSLGMGVFAVALVVRMIADSGPGTRWLRWCTPFGWIELMRPFTHDDAWPVLAAAATVAVLCTAAVLLAARRDAGSGVLASKDHGALRPFGLRSPAGLAARLELPSLAAWCTGIAAGALALGFIAKMATGAVPQSVSDTLDRFGVQGRFVDQYLGVAFLLLASVVALLPASQVAAAVDEEASGRLVHVLARPAERARLFAGRLAFSGAGVAAAGLLAGVAAWAGARSRGIELGLGSMAAAGLNLVPVCLVALGIGAVAVSVAPRAATWTVYAVVVGSLVVDMVASLVDGLQWLQHVSLFHYMALAPAEDPDPLGLAVTTAAAVALGALATARFARRDLQPA